jgi:hypothetical protein
MGSGGIAKLFTGSVDGSTGLTSFIGSGTGQFRYNSDETTTNYTRSLAADARYAIYRERPTLTVTASAQNLQYNTAISTSAFTVSGKNGDTTAQAFSANPTVGVVATLPYPVGTHTLTPSGGTEVLGYSVSYATGTLTVAPKTLTIGGSFTANSKVYDGTATAAIVTNSLTLVGIADGENVTLTPVLAFNDRNAGDSKTVNIIASSTLGGTNGSNYSLSLDGSPTNTANVTAKALTQSGLSSIDKPYDGSRTATVNGTAVLQTAVAASFGASSTDGKPYDVDSVSVAGPPIGEFNFEDVLTATTVSFSNLSLTGSGSGNYTLTAHPTVVNSITAKPLTMTGTAITNKEYDALTTPGTLTLGTLSGLAGTETLTPTGNAADYPSANVGTRASTVTYTLANGANGGLASNYSLAAQSVNGTITAKPLSITSPSIVSKPYNATRTAGSVTVGTLSGFIGDETVSANGAGADYSSANVGTYPGVVVTYTLANGTNGGLATNYSLATGTATGEITAKPLSITAPTITSRVYNASLSAGTVTVGILSGFIGEERVSATGAAANYTSKNVGTYPDVEVSYSLADGAGGLAANYSLANGTATGTITAKPLTISGLSASNKQNNDD